MSKLEKNSNLVKIHGSIHFFTIMEKFVTESNFMQFLKTMGNYFSESSNRFWNYEFQFFDQLNKLWLVTRIMFYKQHL